MIVSAFVLVAIAAITVAAVAYILRSPDAPGRYSFAFSGLAATWWLATVFLRFQTDDLQTKILLCELAWFGIVATPLYWAAGFLNYVGYFQAKKSKYIQIILAIAVFALIAALTNDYHQGIYTGITNTERPSFSHGWLYFVMLGFTYSVLLLATLTTINRLRRAARLHRLQFAGIFAATALPWLANLAFNLFEFRLFNDDPTPFAFAATATTMLLVQMRGKLFTAAPVARDVIFAELPDPIVVVDHNNMVLEVNPAAKAILGLGNEPVGKTLPHDHLLASFAATRPETYVSQSEVIHFEKEQRSFEVSQRSLDDWGRKGCRMLVLRDVTRRVATERRLEGTSHDLQLRLEENIRLQRQLEQDATHDHLTGLYNRRHASAVIPELLANARPGSETALFIVDLDHFKQVNDRFGHDSGDRVLVTFADILLSSLRENDLAFRYGGEEFLIVMSRCGERAALERCEYWRRMLANTPVPGIDDFILTFSAGLALAPHAGGTLEQCVKAADLALYKAKQQGRDRTVAWHELADDTKSKSTSPRTAQTHNHPRRAS